MYVDGHMPCCLQWRGAPANPPSDILKREGLAQSSVQRLVSNAAGFWARPPFFLSSSSSPPPCVSARLHLMETLPPWEAWQVIAPHRNVQSALFVRGTLGIWSHKTSGSFNATHTSKQMAEELCFGH